MSTTRLATINLSTGVVTRVGTILDRFRGLLFDHTGQLWGVTGTMALPNEYVYELDKTDATSRNPRTTNRP